MKIYCMVCGKASEYIGQQNKPSSCICGNVFESSYKSGETKQKSATVFGGKVLVGDMKLEKTFLLDLINIEFEE